MQLAPAHALENRQPNSFVGRSRDAAGLWPIAASWLPIAADHDRRYHGRIPFLQPPTARPPTGTKPVMRHPRREVAIREVPQTVERPYSTGARARIDTPSTTSQDRANRWKKNAAIAAKCSGGLQC